MQDPSALDLTAIPDLWALALAACQNQVWAYDNLNVETYIYFLFFIRKNI
jgi:hypothetical protein